MMPRRDEWVFVKPPRHRELRVPRTAFILLAVLLVTGCPPAEDAAPGAEAKDPIDLVADCPSGDGPWREALAAAGQAGRLSEFEATARRLTNLHEERWEPAWALGERIFRGANPPTAFQSYEVALRRARQARDPTGVACSANRLGFLCYRDAELERAQGFYDEALAAAREAGRADLEAFVLNNLAGLLMRRGDLAEAGSTLEQAIAGLERLGLERPARVAGLNRARILLDLGNAASAMQSLEQLHSTADQAEDRAEASEAAVLLGNTHRVLGQWTEARAWYERVSREDATWVVVRDQHLGRIALLEGELVEARTVLERAVRGAREQGLPVPAMFAEAFLAEVDLREGRPERAAVRLEEVIREAEHSGASDPAWVARGILAKVLLDRRRPGEAVEILREVVKVLEQQAMSLDSVGEGLRFLRERADPYADLAVALVRHKEAVGDADLQQVFEVVETAHARSLRRRFTSRPGADAPVPRLDALRGGLPDDTVLLDFLIGEDRGIVIAVRGDRAIARETPGWRQLQQPLRRYRSALSRPLASAEARLAPLDDFERALPDGEFLTRSLLDPVRTVLTGATRILVVPDRELALLPPASLPDGPVETGAWPRFVGERYETAFMPMAGVPALEWVDPQPILLAGDPVPDASRAFPRLLSAQDELRRLAELWADSEVDVVQRERLTADELTGLSLERYRTIHLATHAVASSLDPHRCAVILSNGERLGLDALGGLRLGPALVILSACRTGEGELVPGEGLIGLGRTFLGTGARAVVVSLWSIEDRPTADLMVSYHRHLEAGADPVSALSLASRAAARERSHPAYWAPFTIALRPD